MNGANGASAQRRANRENNQENVNVTHRLLSMVERCAKASQTKSVFAKQMCPAQVSHKSILLFAHHLFKS